MKIIIAGGTGFIGSHLVEMWNKQKDEVIVLTRHPKKEQDVFWDPERNQIERALFENTDVLINLCGDSIFGRWTDKKKAKIRASRVGSTRALVQIVSELKHPPKLYLGASAIGYYGDRQREILTEESSPGSGFLAETCLAWEESAYLFEQLGCRVVLMRFGAVLGADGGVLARVRTLFQMGLGGRLGSGKQMMSWITVDDLISAVDFCIQHPELTGPFNFTAPNPVSNRQFTEALAHLLRKPAFFMVPRYVLRFLFGEGADEVFLSSAYVIPERLQENGFKFQYPKLEEALKKCLIIKD